MVKHCEQTNNFHRGKSELGFKTEDALKILSEEINELLQKYKDVYKNKR